MSRNRVPKSQIVIKEIERVFSVWNPNEQKMEDQTHLIEMKTYYLRHPKTNRWGGEANKEKSGKPFATVVLVYENGKFCRGISFCSRSDQFCKKVGRSIAETRALHALIQLPEAENQHLPIDSPRVVDILPDDTYYNLDELSEKIMRNVVCFKSERNVQLTEFEKKLFRIDK